MTLNLPRLLLGAIGALSIILALEWLWPGDGDGDGALRLPPPRIAAHAAGGAEAVRDTSAWGAAILQRPLFSISRRPPRVVHSAGAVTAAGQARLAGILITRHAKRAIFAPEGGGKQMVLAEGAAVNDSTIRHIQADRVILASGTVLLPAYDKNRSLSTTPPFQPAVQPAFTPGFPNPGFPNPAFANPNFQNPAFPNPAFPNQAFVPPGAPPPPPANGDDAGIVPPVPASPRNPMIPQRRE